MPPKAWETLDSVETPAGLLELRRRGKSEILVTLGNGILMSSHSTRSEEALATLGCAAAAKRDAPRVLIGGLGLGFTLRAALECLPASARITVAELNEPVVRWCRGLAAEVSGRALSDPRVDVVIGDVRDVIQGSPGRWDAILLDLYEGPHSRIQGPSDHCYTPTAYQQAYAALRRAGTYAIWSEVADKACAKRLKQAGFADVQMKHPGRGSRSHVVYVAVRGGQ
jgi:spermidine synthase